MIQLSVDNVLCNYLALCELNRKEKIMAPSEFRPRFSLALLLATLLSAAFYWWLSLASNHEPAFLLSPIAAVVSAFLDLPLTFEPGMGYLGVTRLGAAFVIDKSCSGAVFWIICFCLLCLTQTPRFATRRQRLLSCCVFLAISYLLALLASILRIIPSILMFDYATSLNPELVHKIIGILTFLTVICTGYLLLERGVTILLRKQGGTYE